MVNVKQNLQFYAQHIEIDHEGTDCLVTVDGVDLAELTDQCSIDDLLDNVEYSVINDYMVKRKAEDEE